MSLVEAVHGVLEAAGIPHGLIGAVALALHGYPRATADTDLLTTSWAVLKDDLWQTLRGQGVDVEDALPLLSEEDVAAIEAGLVHLDEWSRGHWTRIQARIEAGELDTP